MHPRGEQQDEGIETKGRIAVTPKTTLMGVPKAVVDRSRYFVMLLEYAGAPSLPRGPPSPPPGVVVYTVFITAKQWRPVAATLAADPSDQMIVEARTSGAWRSSRTAT
jgi:hypothetical protein